MNQKLILKDLNCPHCTAVIEEKITSLPYVNSAQFNSVTKVMDIDLKSESVSLTDDVKKIVKSTEPSVNVLPYAEEKENDDEDEEGVTRLHIIRLIVGLGLLIGGIFLKNDTLKIALYLLSYGIFGYDVVIRAIKNILKGELFDENFLMSVATIGAFLTGKFTEAVSVMLFYQIGELFQDMAVGKASRSVKNLLKIMPETANLVLGDNITTVSSKEIQTGDIILVRPGERIPLDGTVTEGTSYVDKKALTGESLPEEVSSGSPVLSGMINGKQSLKIEVTKAYSDSTAQKILRLTEEAASKKSKSERFITKFAKIYTPTVVFLAVAIAVIPTIIFGMESFHTWFDRALIFLVASCPCALVISIPLGFFAGLGRASSKGILIKGSTFIQSLAETDTVVFDKTGTLTEGIFKINKAEPVGVSKDELISICGSAEIHSTHPIANAISQEVKTPLKITSFEEISGMGIRADSEKGTILAGNKTLMDKYGIACPATDSPETSVYTALEGNYIGRITATDKIKDDSRNAISSLKERNIKTVLLTGDKKSGAETLNKELALDEVYSDLLPEDKLKKLEELYTKGSKTIAYLGDGINDAPVLRRADVGAAMGGLGSDSAIEAADCVIMSDEPSKIVEAISLSKQTMTRIKQNTTFVIAFKIFVLLISAIGFGNMWLAVFADIGTALLAILNSIR